MNSLEIAIKSTETPKTWAVSRKRQIPRKDPLVQSLKLAPDLLMHIPLLKNTAPPTTLQRGRADIPIQPGLKNSSYSTSADSVSRAVSFGAMKSIENLETRAIRNQRFHPFLPLNASSCAAARQSWRHAGANYRHSSSVDENRHRIRW